MAEAKSETFEAKLDRLEGIVKRLEGNEAGLGDSVQLFQQGRELARECEALLAAAQSAIEAATNGAPAEPERRPSPASASSLFDDDLVDDGE